MIPSGAKFKTFKALQIHSRRPKASALGPVNCVNFGLNSDRDLGGNASLICGVICVNFGTADMLQRAGS